MLKVILFAVALSTLLIAVQAQDFCLQCTSSIAHTECVTPDGSEFNTACNGMPPNGGRCFSRVDHAGNVIRGCFNQLDNTTAAACDSELCEICSGGGGCNSEIFPRHRLNCVTCSGGMNSTCANRTTVPPTVCPIFRNEDRCYVARPNGNFERGCLSSATARCENGEPCLICDGPGCNFENFNSAMTIFSVAKIIPFVLISIGLAAFNK